MGCRELKRTGSSKIKEWKDKILSFDSEKISKVLSLISMLYLLLNYRHGGARDFGLYVENGQNFLKGIDSYTLNLWRSGSFGTSFIGILGWLIPISIQPPVFQLLNMLGIYLFLRLIMQGDAQSNLYKVYFISLWSSPFREMLNTIQITGFVFGLIGFAFHRNYSFRYPKLQFFLKFFALGLAVDLKPHSVLAICILLFFADRERKLIIYSFLNVVIFHILISLRAGKLLELEWLHNLQNLGNASNSSGESTSIWKLLNYISNDKIDFTLPAVILLLVILGIGLRLKSRLDFTSILFFGILITVLQLYTHFYDLIPLVLLYFASFFKKEITILDYICFSLVLIPREFSSVTNIFLVIMMFAFLIFVSSQKRNHYQTFSKVLIPAILGIFASFVIHLLNQSAHLEYRIMHSLVTSEVTLIMVMILGLSIRKELNSELGFSSNPPEIETGVK